MLKFRFQATRHFTRQSCCASLVRQYSVHANHASDRKSDPLKILFCGADAFSITSLKALVELSKREKSPISSIDVLCRSDKPVGRQKRTITPVPIKGAAQELGLDVHQLDDFRNYDTKSLENRINLIVAVSFGLLIPEHVVTSAEYGGLNVHPSLLPDFRGAAPIHHTILQKRRYTGASIQTLHPNKFDHGHILAQTPLPGIEIPPQIKPHQLRETLAEEGARLLRNTIEERLYLPPFVPVVHDEATIDQITENKGLAKASKIHHADSRVDWKTMIADDILLRLRVFGRVWDDVTYKAAGGEDNRQVVYDHLMLDDSSTTTSRGQPGELYLGSIASDSSTYLMITCADGKPIVIKECTISGSTPAKSHSKMQKLLKA